MVVVRVDRHTLSVQSEPRVARLVLASSALVATAFAAGGIPFPPHGAGLAPAVLMWHLMMLPMMLPPTLPWLFALSRLRGTDAAIGRGAFVQFGAAYLAIWSVFSVLAAVAQVWLQTRLMLSHHQALAPAAGGVVLCLAGLYQFTPFKQACLRHCRSPFGALLTHWRGGRWWPLRAGVEHGLHCLGCCWALMLVAFAVGVMNTAWMAVLTLLLVAEQLAPRGALVSRALGAGLLVWGASLVLRG